MNALDRMAGAFRLGGTVAHRWPAALIAAAAGGAAVLALPPLYFVPALIVAFVPVLWLLEGAAIRDRSRDRLWRAALIGWTFGLGYFGGGFFWIGEAFLVDPARTGWLTPFAIGGMAAGLALFTAGGFAATLLAWRRFGLVAPGAAPGRVLVFAAMWTLFEGVRGTVFTGFPWNLIGTVWLGETWMSVAPVAQSASLVGLYGLSLLTVLAASMPAVLMPMVLKPMVLKPMVLTPMATPAGSPTGPARRRAVFFCLCVTLLMPAGLAAVGLARLGLALPIGADPVPDVRLRLVQANIDQSLKWRPDLRLQHLRTHLDMSGWSPARGSDEPNAAPPTHIIWPEAAVPFLLFNDSEAAAAAGGAVPPGGALIAGAMRFGETRTGGRQAGRQGGREGARETFNSIHAIDATGAILATYDKTHLVPFGEYVPLRGILPFDRLVPSQGDLTAGAARATIAIEGLPPFGPLICYEAIFPGAVTARGDRPEWLLNVTNDAWFGRSAGPHQHFAAARARAIEEGLPLVRAANTGISAVIDPYGRVLNRLGLGQTGIIDADLPRPLNPTLFARLGNWIPIALTLIAFVVSLGWRRPSPV